MDTVAAAPKPLTTTRIDDPKRDIETKIIVFNMAPDTKVVVDYVAQVYRRKGGVGEWEVVWTSENCMDDDQPLRLARQWHREHPDLMKMQP